MENLTIPELFSKVWHGYPQNSSYVMPGIYDIKLVDSVWIFTTALIIFTMQTGFALVEAGIVSKKNRVNVMMKNVIDVCFGGLTFWAVGFGLAYGRGEYTSPMFGAGDFFVNEAVDNPLMPQLLLFYFLQASFSTTSATIFSAAIAERCKITAYIFLSCGITMIYAVAAGWVWGEHGFLRNIGVVDFAGAGPIHVIGGTAAFLGAWYIGPRIGRFEGAKGKLPAPLTDPLLACAGLFILWWGWIGFNAGSSYGVDDGKFQIAARAGAGTTLATMGAGVTSFIISMVKNNGKIDVSEVLFGIMSSLVAINAGCFVFSTYASIITGSIAAILYLIVSPIIDNLKIDDACTCTGIHLVNGIWGQISIGLFADPISGPKSLFVDGTFYRLKIQMVSVACLCAFSFTATYILIKLVDWTIGIRLSEEMELEGCDSTEHGIEQEIIPFVNEKWNANLDTMSSPKFVDIHTPCEEFDNFGRRRNNFAINQSYQRD